MKYILILIAALTFSTASNAQTDFAGLVKSTQSSMGNAGEVNFAWWIPVEFWELALLQNGVSAYDAESFLELLEDYVFVAVIEGDVNGLMQVTYTDHSKIKKTIELTGTNGIIYKPLKNGDLPEELIQMLDMFKPMLQSMMGEMGANFNFFVFTDKGKDGSRVCDPYVEGSVELNFSRSSHSIRTPLGPLLAPRLCPLDEEEFSGDFNYCPYHGEKLEEKEEE